MVDKDSLENDYFEWMYDIACKKKVVSFRKLLCFLHTIEFKCARNSRDHNRYCDGLDLRRRYALLQGCGNMAEELDGPCSILEMILALAIRLEETIMDNPAFGDRTRQWFWGMIVSLGLGPMSDANFDKREANEIVNRFLNREYEPNGKGGLFTIKSCQYDLRRYEIWVQANWYLSNFDE